MSIDRTRRPGSGPATSPASSPAASRSGAPQSAPGRSASADLPSDSGTAVLNLTDEQRTRIAVLLNAMRFGGAVADDVRKKIFGLLSGSQRRLLDAAYFIFSVHA